MDHTGIAALAARVKANVQQVIVGMDGPIELMLAAIIARGHVLIEDVPGTGKTVLAKSLAKSMDLDFARIQFTPDLLPSDVTGLSVYNAHTSAFEFRPGPVFTNILLADEINRATPRTQSALLECMEERQVTTDGVTRPLDEPFLVIATQNPIETQGTFPLPEAQLDRFLVRLKLGYLETSAALALLERFIRNDPLAALSTCADKAAVRAAQAAFSNAHVSRPVLEYMVALCEGSRALPNVSMGVSPRGMLALLRASQALAMVRGRGFVTPDDVKALAVPVMAHRIIVRGLYGQADAAQSMIEALLTTVPAPTEHIEERDA